MARIIGVGCQGSSARGRVGSTVFRDDPRLPVGVTVAQSYNPYGQYTNYATQAAQRAAFKAAVGWWRQRWSLDGPANYPIPADWLAEAQLTNPQATSGFSTYMARLLNGVRLGYFIDPVPIVPAPTVAHDAAVPDAIEATIEDGILFGLITLDDTAAQNVGFALSTSGDTTLPTWKFMHVEYQIPATGTRDFAFAVPTDLAAEATLEINAIPFSAGFLRNALGGITASVIMP